MNIVLIGFRGSGKSTVGRALADRLGWSFVDTDAIIQERTGKTIREIFTDSAEEGFRSLEAQVCAEVALPDEQVISTGGGVILRPENVSALRANGRLVYLTAPPEVLWKRIFNDLHRHTTRLRMDSATGFQQVRGAMAFRDPLYTQAADAIVETEGRDVDTIVQRVLACTGLS